MENERRAVNRRKFGYYMPVMDTSTGECVGYLSDVSLKGFKLESPRTIQVNSEYSLRLDLTSSVSSRAYILFKAKAVWSQPDTILPNEYLHGFQITNMGPEEQEIYNRIIDTYGQP
jgi:hypothetical protein